VTDATPRFTAPVVLKVSHNISQFQSGESVLDDWLRERALDNLAAGASRSYVTCVENTARVAAFYALAMGSISATDVTGAMRRNMPKSIQSIVLGRLAVDTAFQGHGLGGMLLQDAVLRSLRAASEVSARLLVVHALSSVAEAFYLHHGFTRLPVKEPMLALDLKKVAAQI
jgi:GNAT superfamily N-acetyltransferase